MADNQADDDDDESFGDFKFVSFPNQPVQNNGKHLPADDDDWGDFVNFSNQINGGSAHPPNGLLSPNFPSNLSGTYNFFDPPQVSQDLAQNNSSPVNEINRVELATTPAEPEKPRWNKPQGALPLSIFGEEEVEEEPTAGHLPSGDDANVFSKKNGDSVEKESDSNGAIRINDLIANLYNQRPGINHDNGSISVLSVSDSNLPGARSNVVSSITPVAASNADANGLNSIVNNLNSDSVNQLEDNGDDDDGWEFKRAESEIQTESSNMKVEQTKHETTGADECAFTFDDGALGAGDMLNSSSRIFRKADEWDLGFEFNPSSAVQNHIQVFESGSKPNLEAPKLAAIDPIGEEVLKLDDEDPGNPDDQYVAAESHWPNDVNFDFYPSSLGEVHLTPESDSKKEQDNDNKNFNAFPANSNADFDVKLFESKDAVSEVGTDQKESQVSPENRREALSLSIFGDEMTDTDEHSVFQGFSSYAPASHIKNSFNSSSSSLSINALWDLYGQAEQNTSHSTPKASENGQAVLDSNLVTDDDDFNDDSWEFKDASYGAGGLESVEKTHSRHKPHVSESGIQLSTTILKPDLINGDDGFGNESWEFKDAFFDAKNILQGSVADHKDLPLQSSAKLEPSDCVDFYCKLTDELCNAVLVHLQNLKNGQSIATRKGEEEKANALQEEIQEFSDMLHQYDVLPNEHIAENQPTRNVCLDKLIEVLKESRFQPLESDYRLTSRLSMAETNIRSAIELLKEALSTLKVLKLGSREEQSNYLTAWSKIALVCSEEMKHGAFIWKQSVQRNVHDQILSNPKGYQYIHALGEICRVAEIVGLSAKLHKPWTLSGSIGPAGLFALLNECYTIWSDSGLEDALLCVSSQNNVGQGGISRELLESIKYIHELDEQELQSSISTGKETACQLSALPAGFVPGLKMVTWNGKQYFVTLANLWMNLVNSDFP